MIEANYTLWHVLFKISMYTLMAIGVMYAIFFYLKKFNPNFKNQAAQMPQHKQPNPILDLMMARFGHKLPKNNTTSSNNVTFTNNSLQCNQNNQLQSLMIESSVQLEVGQTLHIARCGQERFLIASHPQGITILSRLDDGDVLPQINDYQIGEAEDIPTQLSLSDRLKIESRKKHAQQ